MRLLVTGFGPFPGIRSNPSSALARRLGADRRLRAAGITVMTDLLPTTWQAVAERVPPLVALRPDAVLLLGVAGRRRGLSIETRAINRVTRFPDAAGRRAAQGVIAAGAPHVIRGRAPMQRLAVAAGGHGLRARLSINAGTYLCNYSYFRMLEALPPHVPCVFVHVPKLGGRRLLAATDALRALALVLRPK